KTADSVGEPSLRLSTPRAPRYASPVYPLAGLLATAVAGAAFLWRRTRPQRRGQPVEPAVACGLKPPEASRRSDSALFLQQRQPDGAAPAQPGTRAVAGIAVDRLHVEEN